jgi:putative ABC transport system permease protein
LLLRSFLALQHVDPGFDVAHVMTGRVMLADPSAFDTGQKRANFWRQMTAAVAALPGVNGVSTSSSVPLSGAGTSTELAVPGVVPPAGTQPSAGWRVVTPGYFRTMGIPLRGRDFTEADGPDGQPTIIVSEALARLYWPNEDALGRTIVPRTLGSRPRTIVGVVGDVRSSGLDDVVRPMVYFSGLSSPVFNPMYVVWRSSIDPASHVPAIREAIRAINPRVALYNVTAAGDLLDGSFGPRRLNLYLLGLFASVALALAAIGLFGVMAYLVSQRAREIGVRLALGANRRDIFGLVIGQGLAMTVCGALVGIIGAFVLTRLMKTMLFSVSTTDPVTFVAVPVLLIGVALAACYVPARRAMQVDPVKALRAD